MFVVLAAIFYFLLIRPQMKQVKEHRKLVESLAKGDEVVTNGGLLGRINEVGDNFLVLEIAKDIEVKVQKQSVTQVMPKGTLKTL
jgi:preprotein translocase subunit YajC